MQVAEKFRRPIFTLVDTDGAYPGIHAEERGQAEAIAYNLREMARLEVPIIATVIGVGGSGGRLAIAVADRVLMMENSIYSVISPEGCAAIMWRDATKKELAAEAMRITATDLRNWAASTTLFLNRKAEPIATTRPPPTCSMPACRSIYAELKKTRPRRISSHHDIISSGTSPSSSRPKPECRELLPSFLKQVPPGHRRAICPTHRPRRRIMECFFLAIHNSGRVGSAR